MVAHVHNRFVRVRLYVCVCVSVCVCVCVQVAVFEGVTYTTPILGALLADSVRSAYSIQSQNLSPTRMCAVRQQSVSCVVYP